MNTDEWLAGRKQYAVTAEDARRQDIDGILAFVCTAPEDNGDTEPCESCRDFMARLIVACDPSEGGLGLIHAIDELLREGPVRPDSPPRIYLDRPPEDVRSSPTEPFTTCEQRESKS